MAPISSEEQYRCEKQIVSCQSVSPMTPSITPYHSSLDVVLSEESLEVVNPSTVGVEGAFLTDLEVNEFGVLAVQLVVVPFDIVQFSFQLLHSGPQALDPTDPTRANLSLVSHSSSKDRLVIHTPPGGWH